MGKGGSGWLAANPDNPSLVSQTTDMIAGGDMQKLPSDIQTYLHTQESTYIHTQKK